MDRRAKLVQARCHLQAAQVDSSPEATAMNPRPFWAWYGTLLVPFVATLWVPFYDRLEPRLGGVPFFYWYLYLFLWILISATQTGVVYFVTRSSRASE
jgi:hypothetical protein